MITISKSPIETKNLAGKFLKEWLADKKNRDKNLLVCLEGDLGGGKTTFAQGIAEALEIKEAVTSPTFLIMKKYQAPRKRVMELSSGYPELSSITLYHFDCYRVKGAQEILDLGWKEIVKEKDNIILVEWAEKIKKILPKDGIWIKFGFVDEDRRKLEINY